jgi:hypothetical protein
MDMCPFFSDKKLKKMEPHESGRAIGAAYGLTVEMIRILRPPMAQSMADNKNKLGWGVLKHHLAYRLGSSTAEAKAGDVYEMDLGDCPFKVVKGIHPATIT